MHQLASYSLHWNFILTIIELYFLYIAFLQISSDASWKLLDWCKQDVHQHGCSIISREDELVEHAKALTVNVGTDPSADVGPVISIEVKTCLQNF